MEIGINVSYKSLYQDECDKYGILYHMKDIIEAYKKEDSLVEQMVLFDSFVIKNVDE